MEGERHNCHIYKSEIQTTIVALAEKYDAFQVFFLRKCSHSADLLVSRYVTTGKKCA